MATTIAFKRGLFNTAQCYSNTLNRRVCSRQQGEDVGAATIASDTTPLETWIQHISDRRGFPVDLLTKLCGAPGNGHPIELWGPEDLDTPEKCRACWGADPLARIAIDRPPLRAIRFMNSDGAIFQVAFEAQTQSGRWLAINDWIQGASKKFGDRLWHDWVKPSDRSHLGKYLSPVGEGSYRPVWTPDFGCAGKAIDWEAIGGNKRACKTCLEGPWKAVAAWFDLGLTPITLAGVDAGVCGFKSETPGQLRTEVAKLLATGQIFIAFDKDIKPATIKRVSESVDRLVKAIDRLKPASPNTKGKRTRRIVKSLDWPTQVNERSTKGIDDLVQVVGVEAIGQYLKTVPVARVIARGRAITITKTPNLEIELEGTESLATHADRIWEALKLGYRNFAIFAPTGAGKTETVKQFLNDLTKELAKRIARPLVYLSPRVSLNASEAAEFDATNRPDLDSVSYLCEETGKYINQKLPPENGRIAMCLEGFESISVTNFFSRETVLFCDEFDQMLDQTISGGTLKGRVRAAYNWLSDAFCSAGITIIASAGLRDHHIDWVEETTGNPVFLVSAKRTGDEAKYTTTIDQGKDFSAVVERLEKLVVEGGDRVLLSWDNRGDLTAAKEYFDRTHIDENGNPKYRFLIATRETANDPEIKDLISNKGEFFARQISEGNPVHVLGFTTTAGTGWNLKDPDPSTPLFSHVFGVFSGAITPEAARQMLNRYRRNCPRTVWARQKSTKRGRISKATTTNGVFHELIESRRRAAKATRSSEDFAALEASGVLEEKSLFLRTYAESLATENATREHHRETIAAKLEAEGRTIEWVTLDSDSALRDEIFEVKAELTRARAIALYNAPKLSLSEYLTLERKESKTSEDYLAIERFKFEEYYLLDLNKLDQDPAVDFILADNKGNRRSGLRQLSRVLGKYHAMHVSRDIASIHRAIEDRAVWEIRHDSAISNLFKKLRFAEILELESYTTKTPLIQEIYEAARKDKKLMAGVRRWLDSDGKILNTSSATAFVNAILRGIDVQVSFDKESKVWEIDQVYLAESVGILDRQFEYWAKQNQIEIEPIAQAQPEPTPEPIAQAQPEPTPEPIAQAQPEPTPAPEFWTVTDGKHAGKTVRTIGNAKDGIQRVQAIGEASSIRVESQYLKPVENSPTPRVATVSEILGIEETQPITSPVENAPNPEPTSDSAYDRAVFLYQCWVNGAVGKAAAAIRGWFKTVDLSVDPLGSCRLKTAVCAALPGLQTFWEYVLIYG